MTEMALDEEEVGDYIVKLRDILLSRPITKSDALTADTVRVLLPNLAGHDNTITTHLLGLI